MTTKAAPKDIKDRQFVREHFGEVTDFDAFLQGAIDDQEKLLTARIGAALYNSTTTEIADQVKQASINMVCADLTQRRIVRASGNITEDTAKILDSLGKVKKDFETAAADAINRIVNSGAAADSGGFSSGVVVTTHFDGSAS